MNGGKLRRAIEAHIANMDVVTCSAVAKAIEPDLGYPPSLMAISRILNTQAQWTKLDARGPVTFRRLEADELAR